MIQAFRNQQKDTAIVFVHGFTGHIRETWRQIPDHLMASPALSNWDLWGFGYESHKWIDLTKLWSSDASLEEIATMLCHESAFQRYKKLALVAHSMGGLVVQRAIVKTPAFTQRVSHMFLFGTPSAGLVKANLPRFLKQQIEDMTPEGPFVRQLRSDWTASGFNKQEAFALWVTAGEIDQFVPPESSLKPFPESVHRVIPGNHVTMLEAPTAMAECVQTILQGITQGTGTGPRDAGRIAIERGRFEEVVATLWEGRDGLDRVGAVQLALALESLGRQEEAIAYLQTRASDHTDIMGTFAGRLKRRWQLKHQQQDFDLALRMYSEAFQKSEASQNDSQAYYHGINIAYLLLATDQVKAARDIAAKVLTHTAPFTPVKQEDKLWHAATEADALVILGRAAEGLAKHEQASKLPMEPWQALSIQEQALRVGALCGLAQDQIDSISRWYGGKSTAAA